MMRFSGQQKKAGADTKDLEQGVTTLVIATPAQLAIHTTTTMPELFGLELALSDASYTFPRPKFDTTNTLIAAGASASMATEITTLIVEGPETETKYALIASGCNLAIANGAQIYKYYQDHVAIQQLQRRFLENILDLLDACYFITLKDERIDLPPPFSLESITAFMYTHGSATFELRVPDTVFTLHDNSFSSRVGMTLAGATAITALATGLSMYYRLMSAAQDNSPEEVALRISTSVVPNIPFTSLANALLKWRDRQESNILKAMNLVMQNVYVIPRQMHRMPLPFLETFAYFLSTGDMEKNRALREQYIQAHHEAEIRKALGTKPSSDGKAASSAKKLLM